MGGAVGKLFGGGKAEKQAAKSAEEARNRQLAELARKQAEVDQQAVAGSSGNARGRRLLAASRETLGSAA